MANFGFSVGDLVMVSKYVYSAYRSIPHAGDEYVSIAEDSKINLLIVLLISQILTTQQLSICICGSESSI